MDKRSDQELLREYAGRGSEKAFTALVKRHTSLVYGTACRKLGNASLAEEITQSVFVILARKAPFLCHRDNLSGWLHQTTLLECRHRLRSELRRQRREETAMQMHEPGNDSSLAHEVDDALLELAEKDRQPLLLRFFECLSLREVGQNLGVHEDAAQKRVAKSLDLLERILRRRGRDIGSAALALALAESAQAAPAHLAVSAAQVALTSGGAAASGGVIFAKFMALTKTQTIAVGVLAVAAPLLFQARQIESARAEQKQSEATLAYHESRNTAQIETVRRLRRNLEILEADRQALNAISKGRQNIHATPTATAASLYLWPDSSAYLRLPKSILNSVKLTSAKNRSLYEAGQPTNAAPRRLERSDALDAKGNLSPALIEALALNEQENASVTASLKHFADQFDSVAAQHTILTNIMPPGIGFQVAKDGKLYTLLTQEFPEQGQELKRQLVAELESAIDAERVETLMGQGHDAFDHDFLEFGARQRWVTAAPQDDGLITIGRAQASNGNSLGGSVTTVPADQVPASLRPYLPQSLFAKP